MKLYQPQITQLQIKMSCGVYLTTPHKTHDTDTEKFREIQLGKNVKQKSCSLYLTMLHQLYWVRRPATRYGLEDPGM
jgi:hypothetical protein